MTVQADDTSAALAGLSEGGQLYRNNCASCHNLSGQGLNGLPVLQNHPVLMKPTADHVAMAVLQGVWPEKGKGMIGFSGSLNDGQIAAVTNYVMQDIGHSQVHITAERVKTLRAGGEAAVTHWHGDGGYCGAAGIGVVAQKARAEVRRSFGVWKHPRILNREGNVNNLLNTQSLHT